LQFHPVAEYEGNGLGQCNACFQLASEDANNLEGYATLKSANQYYIARTGSAFAVPTARQVDNVLIIMKS